MENNSFTIQLVDIKLNKEAYKEPTMLKKIYIITNYVDADLQYIMRNASELTYNQVKTIAYNMLIAIRFLHLSGVIHRDLKPNNILINSSCQVYLCDFGWARTVIS